jgi:hypothetical protein
VLVCDLPYSSNVLGVLVCDLPYSSKILGVLVCDFLNAKYSHHFYLLPPLFFPVDI